MLYAYAVLGEPVPRLSGAHGERLRGVKVGALRVAAGVVAQAPEPEVAALRAHDAVVRALAARVEALLPMRFGEVAPDARALRERLEPRAAELAQALAEVRGCVQLTLRLHGTVAPPPVSGGPGARWLLARAAESRAHELDPLRPRLAGLVRGERVQREPGQVSVWHLVPRVRLEEYRALVAGASLGVRVEVSGPAAPYAFAPLAEP